MLRPCPWINRLVETKVMTMRMNKTKGMAMTGKMGGSTTDSSKRRRRIGAVASARATLSSSRTRPRVQVAVRLRCARLPSQPLRVRATLTRMTASLSHISRTNSLDAGDRGRGRLAGVKPTSSQTRMKTMIESDTIATILVMARATSQLL